MTTKELRETLETLPCPFCTKDIEDDVLEDIIFDTDVEMKDYFLQVRDGSISKDKYNEIWWRTLEQLANKYKIPYYEDFEEQ